MGQSLSRVHRLDCAIIQDRRTPFDMRMVDLLEDHLEKNHAIKLVVIDPVSSYVGRAGVDDHKTTELRGVLDHLHGMCERRKTACLLIGHVNKAEGRDASLRINGSLAYRDTCRAVWIVGKHPTDDSLRVIALNKCNVLGMDRSSIAYTIEHPADYELDVLMNHPATDAIPIAERERFRNQLVRVALRGKVDLDSNDIMASPRKERSSQSDECEKWLREFMGEFAWPDAELVKAAEKAGFNERMLRRVKGELRKRREFSSRKVGFGADAAWWNWFGERDNRPADRPPHTDHTDQTDHTFSGGESRSECGEDDENGIPTTKGTTEKYGQYGRNGQYDGELFGGSGDGLDAILG